MNEINHQEGPEVEAQVEQFLAVWFKMRQQVQGLNFNRAHQNGLSSTQFVVLSLLDGSPDASPATISGLAGRMNLDPATVLRSVDSLEKRGLVDRRRDLKDRRVVFVELTEAGRQTQHAAFQDFKDRLSRIFSSMSEAGRLALLAGLEAFLVAAQDYQENRDR